MFLAKHPQLIVYHGNNEWPVLKLFILKDGLNYFLTSHKASWRSAKLFLRYLAKPLNLPAPPTLHPASPNRVKCHAFIFFRFVFLRATITQLTIWLVKYVLQMPNVRLELATPGLQTQCSSHWAIQLKSRSWVYPVGVLHHYIFIISQLWLTSHPRSTVVLLDTETSFTQLAFGSYIHALHR